MDSRTEPIDAALRRGVAELIVEREVRARLASGRPLRLKQGFDPTRPDMHIGHTVGLRTLRRFQDLGHQVVLVVGDWTAQIGDPSGRDEGRPRLDAATVQRNAQTYMEQFFRVVDRQRTEVRWQSEWYGEFSLEELLGLAGRFTLAQMLAHETFRRRHEAGAAVSILELMYPMLQGHDSVVIQADIEVGGTDQKFNNLAGRTLMGQLGMVPQEVLLVPLIPGTDGRKMSKSLGNTVDIAMAPAEKFARIMAMADGALPLLFETLTDVPLEEVRDMERAIAAGEAHPMALKRRLAREVVAGLDSPVAAAAAEEGWLAQFSRRELPADMPEHTVGGAVNIVELLADAGLAASRSEARRLIGGGGVRVDGERVEGPDLLVEPPAVVQVGRRRFVRVLRAGV